MEIIHGNSEEYMIPSISFSLASMQRRSLLKTVVASGAIGTAALSAGTAGALEGPSVPEVSDTRTLPADEAREAVADLAKREEVQRLLSRLSTEGFEPDRTRVRVATVDGETRRQLQVELATPTDQGDAHLWHTEKIDRTEAAYFPTGSRMSAEGSQDEIVWYAVEDGKIRSNRTEAGVTTADLEYCYGPNDLQAGLLGLVADVPDICDICWECDGDIDYSCVVSHAGQLGITCYNVPNPMCAAAVFFASDRAADACCSEGGGAWLDCCNVPYLC